jgi:hypothetical protein
VELTLDLMLTPAVKPTTPLTKTSCSTAANKASTLPRNKPTPSKKRESVPLPGTLVWDSSGDMPRNRARGMHESSP